MCKEVDSSAKVSSLVNTTVCKDYTPNTYSDRRLRLFCELLPVAQVRSVAEFERYPFYMVRPGDFYWTQSTFGTAGPGLHQHVHRTGPLNSWMIYVYPPTESPNIPLYVWPVRNQNVKLQ